MNKDRRNIVLGLTGLTVLSAFPVCTVLLAKELKAKKVLSKARVDELRKWGKTMDKVKKVTLSDEQWKSRLEPLAYKVLRKEATERAGSSELNNEKRIGEYLCAGCGLLLFTSDMKYDSGTGWPSFFNAIKEHIGTKTDYKLIYPRTEYHCKRCGGHQGHVFNDGPHPTGKRYCNNGVALKFEEKN